MLWQTEISLESSSVFRKEHPMSKEEVLQNIIKINRACFNPVKFIGSGWSIIAEETDTRSVALTQLDISKIQFVTMLSDDDFSVNGEENLKRLKSSDYIRLDANIFLTLWENQHLIPEWLKEKVNGNTVFIYFDGMVLRDSGGRRCVLLLYWGGLAWDWDVRLLVSDWGDSDLSAVLKA